MYTYTHKHTHIDIYTDRYTHTDIPTQTHPRTHTHRHTDTCYIQKRCPSFLLIVEFDWLFKTLPFCTVKRLNSD